MTGRVVDSLALQTVLAPVSGLFGGGVRLRNRMFDRGILRAHRLPVPVICVGNITVGGTGKTPLAGLIASHLRGRGLRVAVLSRGYGRVSREEPLVVSEGRGPLVSAEAGGDEPVLLARMLQDVAGTAAVETAPGVAIVVGADRVKAGLFAIERLGAEVLVLDDGFQHRRLARDLDIVVLDCFDPFGRYRLLPAGRLREPLSGLGRAGLFVVTRSAPADALHTLSEVIRARNPHAPIVRAHQAAVGLVGGRGLEPLPPVRGTRIGAFCAIGSPEAFRLDLIRLGFDVAVFRSFRDHHRYTPTEIEALRIATLATGAGLLVTTEKDAVRVPGGVSGAGIVALRIRYEINPSEPFFGAIDAAAARAGTNLPAGGVG